MQKKGIALFIIFVLSAVVVAFALSTFVTIHNYGRIKAIGLEISVDSINWGTVESGSNVSYIVEMMPSGNVPVNVTFKTSAWDPANASDYLSLSWNYTGEIFEPDVWYPVEFTLRVADDITGIDNFNFDIVVTAKEVK